MYTVHIWAGRRAGAHIARTNSMYLFSLASTQMWLTVRRVYVWTRFGNRCHLLFFSLSILSAQPITHCHGDSSCSEYRYSWSVSRICSVCINKGPIYQSETMQFLIQVGHKFGATVLNSTAHLERSAMIRTRNPLYRPLTVVALHIPYFARIASKLVACSNVGRIILIFSGRAI